MTQTAATRQRMATSTQNEAQQTAANVLEEVMEEANVTDLRNGLLPTIERIQENPAIKIVIRKHGKRRAVLMMLQPTTPLCTLQISSSRRMTD